MRIQRDGPDRARVESSPWRHMAGCMDRYILLGSQVNNERNDDVSHGASEWLRVFTLHLPTALGKQALVGKPALRLPTALGKQTLVGKPALRLPTALGKQTLVGKPALHVTPTNSLRKADPRW